MMKFFLNSLMLVSIFATFCAYANAQDFPMPMQMQPSQMMPPPVIIVSPPPQSAAKAPDAEKKQKEPEVKNEIQQPEKNEDFEEDFEALEDEPSQMRISDDNTPDAMISALIFKNPFGSSGLKTPEEITGISLKSAVLVNGQWSFSVASKDGKSVWLKLNEQSEVIACKILEFDEKTMIAKLLISGKNFDFFISDSPKSPQDKSKEAAKRAIKNRQGGKLIWDYASAEQARQANEIYRLAQQQGRKLTAQERKKLREIESAISVPEHAKKK